MTEESMIEQMRRRRAGAASAAPAEPEHAAVVDDYIAADYKADDRKQFTVATGNRRQPGFSLAAGTTGRHWVFYHSVKRLRFMELDGGEYINFAHENLAVTIEGHGLEALFNQIGEGRLKAIFAPGKAVTTLVGTSETIITGILVTDVEEEEEKERNHARATGLDATKQTRKA